MSASQDPTRREDLLFMLLHGGAASNSIASHVVDMAIGEALDQQKAELAALRPRGAVKLLASSWSLWQLYQRARRLWRVAAAFASGAAAQNR